MKYSFSVMVLMIALLLSGCIKEPRHGEKWDRYLLEIAFNSCATLLYPDFKNNFGLNLKSSFKECKTRDGAGQNFTGLNYKVVFKSDYMILSAFNKKYNLFFEFDSRVTNPKDVRSLDYI